MGTFSQKDKSSKICAVVVTYNRNALLLESLEALRKQTKPLQGIYIIDNASTDGTPEVLKENGYIKETPPKNIQEPWERTSKISNLTDGSAIELHYVRMHKNTGSAGGFYEGIKRAFEKGYDWLWIMDDDVEPELTTLEKLSTHFDKRALTPYIIFDNQKTSSLSSAYRIRNKTFLIISRLRPVEIESESLVQVDVTPFAGLLIHREIVQKIGLPDKRFFFNYDDGEYSLRISQFTKIFLVKDAKVVHKFSKTRNTKPFKKNLWRLYYSERNKIIVRKRYIKSKLALIAFLIADFVILSIKATQYLLMRFPWKEVKIFYLAFLDALTENFDRNINEIN